MASQPKRAEEDLIFSNVENGGLVIGLRFKEKKKKSNDREMMIFIKMNEQYGKEVAASINKYMGDKLTEKSPSAKKAVASLGTAVNSFTGPMFGKSKPKPSSPTPSSPTPTTEYQPSKRSLWIPFCGKIKWTQCTPPPHLGLKTWYELGFVPSDPKNADKLLDPKVGNEVKAAIAVGMIVDVLIKLPFSGDIAEMITLYPKVCV